MAAQHLHRPVPRRPPGLHGAGMEGAGGHPPLQPLRRPEMSRLGQRSATCESGGLDRGQADGDAGRGLPAFLIIPGASLALWGAALRYVGDHISRGALPSPIRRSAHEAPNAVSPCPPHPRHQGVRCRPVAIRLGGRVARGAYICRRRRVSPLDVRGVVACGWMLGDARWR